MTLPKPKTDDDQFITWLRNADVTDVLNGQISDEFDVQWRCAAMKRLGVKFGPEYASVEDTIRCLTPEASFILKYNTTVDLFKHIAEQSTALLGTNSVDAVHNLFAAEQVGQMSAGRVIWFILSHLYVFGEVLGKPVRKMNVESFVFPVGSNTIRTHIKTAELNGFVELKPTIKNGREIPNLGVFVNLTDIGRNMVLNYTRLKMKAYNTAEKDVQSA